MTPGDASAPREERATPRARAPSSFKRAGVSAQKVRWFVAYLVLGAGWCVADWWWANGPAADPRYERLGFVIAGYVVSVLFFGHATVQQGLARSAEREAAYARVFTSRLTPSIKTLRVAATLLAMVAMSLVFAAYCFLSYEPLRYGHVPADALSHLWLTLTAWAAACSACVVHSVYLASPSRVRTSPDVIARARPKAPVDMVVKRNKDRIMMALIWIAIWSMLFIPSACDYVAQREWSSKDAEWLKIVTISWVLMSVPAVIGVISGMRNLRRHVAVNGRGR